jgi:hypothetical protein
VPHSCFGLARFWSRAYGKVAVERPNGDSAIRGAVGDTPAAPGRLQSPFEPGTASNVAETDALRIMVASVSAMPNRSEVARIVR